MKGLRLQGALQILTVVALFLAACNNQPSGPAAGVATPSQSTSASQATAVSVAATASPQAKVTLIVQKAATSTARAPVSYRPSATATTQSPTSIPPSPKFDQLTTGGCCVQPFFSPDGSHVLYLDKPAPNAPVGLWAVTVTQPLATPMFYSSRLGPFSADLSLNAFLQNGQTIVERASDGARWAIDNGGRRVIFSPDDTHIAWNVSEESGNFDVRQDDIYVANVDGTGARKVLTLYGGGVQGWFHDSSRMLLGGKASRYDLTPTLSILSLAGDNLTKLIDVERARDIQISPDDHYLAYYVAQARDEAQDGMFVLDLTRTPYQPQRVDFFGAYRWCSAQSHASTRLLYVPMQPGAPSQSLWRFDVKTLRSSPVITPSAAGEAASSSLFHISDGDWDLSPDGMHLIYVNTVDHNIWLITLPQAC